MIPCNNARFAGNFYIMLVFYHENKKQPHLNDVTVFLCYCKIVVVVSVVSVAEAEEEVVVDETTGTESSFL